ncbi:MAG TPA: hypothetical protein VNI54_13235 [Thermoanaerobaculia bacterium]|nr:hypothetical protein [Thermoanaerobaculia bacterium]
MKAELDTINASIRQMDDITKGVKEWTVGLWTAAVGGALITPRLSALVGITVVIPLLFWFVDTWHRRIQRKFIWRNDEISRFLNGPDLVKSFVTGQLVNFTLLDPASRSARDQQYLEFISWRKVMWFKSISIFYVGLMSLSVIIGLFGLLGFF